MTWKLRLNPYPSALSMVGMQHGLPGFCNEFAMLGHAFPFFQLVSVVGDVLPSICSLFRAAWFTFAFDGGGAAGHINRGSMEFEEMVN